MTRNKYGNTRVSVDGINFASKAEAKRYGELKLLERADAIQSLACHPKFLFTIAGKPLLFPNGHQAKFTGDFQYIERGQLVVEDVKSSASKTEAYALRAALFRALFPKITFIEIGGKKKPKADTGWIIRRGLKRREAGKRAA